MSGVAYGGSGDWATKEGGPNAGHQFARLLRNVPRKTLPLSLPYDVSCRKSVGKRKRNGIKTRDQRTGRRVPFLPFLGLLDRLCKYQAAGGRLGLDAEED